MTSGRRGARSAAVALLAAIILWGCVERDAPRNTAAGRDETPATAHATVPSPPWYARGRRLDLTGDGRADSAHLEARGSRPDSLRIMLSLHVAGEEEHRETWGSSYELALADTATRTRPGAAAYLRARLDSVLASVTLERFDAAAVRIMTEDSAVLARLDPAPTHRVSFAYGYETTVRLAWDAPRARFVRLWSCC